MAGRIYPVPIKPRSQYNSWLSWPQELVPAIKLIVKGWYRGYMDWGPTFGYYGGVFKCADCKAFCYPHPNGVATLHDGSTICDDCVIERAQKLGL
jgi:hypothetical protein